MDAALVTDPIITTDMPFEEYIQKYARDFYELEKGNLIRRSSIHELLVMWQRWCKCENQPFA